MRGGYIRQADRQRLVEHKERNSVETNGRTDKAIRQTASATMWMAFFTFVLAFVNIGTLLILKDQLNEIHTEFVASQRPWITASISSSSSSDNRFQFTQVNGWSYNFTLSLENIGNAPATHVEMTSTVSLENVTPYDTATPLLQQTVLCNRAEPSKSIDRLVTIFPKEAAEISGGAAELIQTVVDPRANKTPTPVNKPKEVIPTIIGCIVYKSPVSAEVHKTGFIIEIMKKDPKHPGSATGIINGESVPASDVIFRSFRYSGQYAN